MVTRDRRRCAWQGKKVTVLLSAGDVGNRASGGVTECNGRVLTGPRMASLPPILAAVIRQAVSSN